MQVVDFVTVFGIGDFHDEVVFYNYQNPLRFPRLNKISNPSEV